MTDPELQDVVDEIALRPEQEVGPEAQQRTHPVEVDPGQHDSNRCQQHGRQFPRLPGRRRPQGSGIPTSEATTRPSRKTATTMMLRSEPTPCHCAIGPIMRLITPAQARGRTASIKRRGAEVSGPWFWTNSGEAGVGTMHSHMGGGGSHCSGAGSVPEFDRSMSSSPSNCPPQGTMNGAPSDGAPTPSQALPGLFRLLSQLQPPAFPGPP